ncbi:DUF397 domain-containing protein [Streptomyces nondiastaticus]|uniref:DUF397 domain-containing protein n=1 Tax=Streptomyces nondiastaticus TaxID=3154512 RepID=A0ABW6U232_9ACTN
MREANWRKSSYSGHQTDCVQIADGIVGAVPVRDSKAPDGPTLALRPAAWAAFISGLKSGGVPPAASGGTPAAA